jgi:adenosylcobinamide-phosphate synthase
MRRSDAAALGVLADRVLGEPPDDLHPVAAFGRAMQALEQRLYADDRSAGVVHAVAGVAGAAVAGAVVPSTAVATWAAVAGRALGETATEIGDVLVGGDLDGARARLPSLVGRDPSELEAKDVARAVVESVAENTVDAVVAPALWAAVAGAPGVLAHRAINTMDAMVGPRSARYERYGWAAARLDDVAAWVPARATAALVAAVRPSAAAAIWTAVRRDAPAHPSPNSGVAEAAFAAALGLRLGGESRYGDRVELRPPLGDGRPPEPADIARAVRLSHDVGLAVGASLVLAPRLLPSIAVAYRRLLRAEAPRGEAVGS